jgi:GAF domain-containing protein
MGAELERPEDAIARLEAENALLRRETGALRQFIDALQNLVEAVERPLPDTEIMNLLAEMLGSALATIRATDGSLLVLDEDSGELVFVLACGEGPRERLHWRRLPRGEGIAGWVAEHRSATIVNDARMDDRFYPVLDEELGYRTRSVIAAPIIGGGKLLGVVEIVNKRDGELFNFGDQTLLSLLCRFAGELLHSVIESSQARPPRDGRPEAASGGHA